MNDARSRSASDESAGPTGSLPAPSEGPPVADTTTSLTSPGRPPSVRPPPDRRSQSARPATVDRPRPGIRHRFLNDAHRVGNHRQPVRRPPWVVAVTAGSIASSGSSTMTAAAGRLIGSSFTRAAGGGREFVCAPHRWRPAEGVRAGWTLRWAPACEEPRSAAADRARCPMGPRHHGPPKPPRTGEHGDADPEGHRQSSDPTNKLRCAHDVLRSCRKTCEDGNSPPKPILRTF